MNWPEARDALLSDEHTAKAYYTSDLGWAVGEMVFSARREKNLTQKQLAQKINSKQPAIARLENGSLPTLSFLERIADALDMGLEIRLR